MKRQHNLKIRQGKPIYTGRLCKGRKMVKNRIAVENKYFSTLSTGFSTGEKPWESSNPRAFLAFAPVFDNRLGKKNMFT